MINKATRVLKQKTIECKNWEFVMEFRFRRNSEEIQENPFPSQNHYTRKGRLLLFLLTTLSRKTEEKFSLRWIGILVFYRVVHNNWKKINFKNEKGVSPF